MATRAKVLSDAQDAIRAMSPAALPFAEIVVDALKMHAKKSKDYGTDGDPYSNVRASEEYGIKPWVGALVRANDKAKRLKIAACGGTLANEGVEDSLIDSVVYYAIALLLYREEHADAEAGVQGHDRRGVVDSDSGLQSANSMG